MEVSSGFHVRLLQMEKTLDEQKSRLEVESQLRHSKSELLTKLQHRRDKVQQRCLEQMAASKQQEGCLLVAQGEATSLRSTMERRREALRELQQACESLSRSEEEASGVYTKQRDDMQNHEHLIAECREKQQQAIGSLETTKTKLQGEMEKIRSRTTSVLAKLDANERLLRDEIQDLEREKKDVDDGTRETTAASDALEQKLKDAAVRQDLEMRSLQERLKNKRADLATASEESQRVEARLYEATQERDGKRKKCQELDDRIFKLKQVLS